ncbi:hypothetical protein GQ42DRAFT_129829 [Ramicandelaber brevisporus]|nr:hypothetical protein GQ42DRAFT_129829 [Ramicandelaber brevisporus]
MLMLLPITAIGAVGTLGKESLAVFASARTISTFAVFGPMLGVATTLETLCSQSFTGAADTNPHLTGYWLQRLIVIVTIMFVCAELLLWKSEWLFRLVFSGNSDHITQQCVVFLRWDILYYYVAVVVDSVKRYLFAQEIKAASVIGVTVAVPVCMVSSYYLITNPATSVGVIGAPTAIGCAYLTILLSMILYIRITGHGRSTWGGWDWKEATRDWQLFATLGIPSAITVTIEYGSQEIIAVAAAHLEPLALAVHPIVASSYRMGINAMAHPVGLVNAARVGHVLGDANAKRAKRVAFIGSVLGCAISTLAALLLFGFRREVAQYYSTQLDVIMMVSSLFPYAAIAVLFIGINSGFDGILRGQGRQLQGFLFKVVSFYVLALPVGYVLAFVWGWGVKGLWTGLAVGGFATAVLQVWWIARTNWSYEVLLCQMRLGKTTIMSDDEAIGDEDISADPESA